MASNNTPAEMMSALIEERKPKVRSENVIIGTVYWDSKAVPAIFSYGKHFPMAVKNGPDWGVTTDRYSRTTNVHLSGVRRALTEHGFEAMDKAVFHVNGVTFERWTKVRA